MAIATNTTEGEILIGGDLDPTSTGDMPLLRASGVTPGAYNYSAVGVDGSGNSIIKITKAVIDPKGRITYAKSENYTITSVVATSSTFGIVKVDGTSITVSDGVISFSGASIPLATSSTLGKAKPDNITTSISGGILSVSMPAATSSVLGGVKYDNVSIYNGTGGTASVYTATNSVLGLSKPDDATLKIVDGKLELAKATSFANGIAKPDFVTISYSGAGENRIFRIANASSSTFGRVRPDNTTITIENGIISAPVIYATNSVFGIAKADETTLSIGAEGVISLAKATSSSLGLVKPDETTLTVNSGILSVLPARVGFVGTVKPDNSTIKIDGTGKIFFETASSSLYGVAKPDNVTVTIEAGKLKFASFSTANSVSIGAVKPDNSTVVVSSGILTVPNATSSVVGLVKPDDDTISVSSGVISNTLPLTPATISTIGLVVPDNDTINISAGTINAEKATTTTLGIAKGDNTTITATGGVLSLVNSVTGSYGAVKPNGTSIGVTDGVLSTILHQATDTVLGFAKLSDSVKFNSSTSKNYIPIATSADAGLAYVESTYKPFTLASGIVSDNSVDLGAFNVQPDPQFVMGKTLTGGGTQFLDVSTSNSSNIFILRATSGTMNIDGFVNTAFEEGTQLTLICQKDTGCNITFSTSSSTGFGGLFNASRTNAIIAGADDTGFTVIQLVIVNIGGQPYGVQVSNTAYSGIRI